MSLPRFAGAQSARQGCAYGCPLQAIVVAFHLDERTVLHWQRRAGQQCQHVHEHLVQQPRDLGQVQLDELRVKTQGGIVWLACALQVSTRLSYAARRRRADSAARCGAGLWLGGALSAQRDHHLIVQLVQRVRGCAHVLRRTALPCGTLQACHAG